MSLSGLRPDGYTYLYMVDGAPTMDRKNSGPKVGPRGYNNRFLCRAPRFLRRQARAAM